MKSLDFRRSSIEDLSRWCHKQFEGAFATVFVGNYNGADIAIRVEANDSTLTAETYPIQVCDQLAQKGFLNHVKYMCYTQLPPMYGRKDINGLAGLCYAKGHTRCVMSAGESDLLHWLRSNKVPMNFMVGCSFQVFASMWPLMKLGVEHLDLKTNNVVIFKETNPKITPYRVWGDNFNLIDNGMIFKVIDWGACRLNGDSKKKFGSSGGGFANNKKRLSTIRVFLEGKYRRFQNPQELGEKEGGGKGLKHAQHLGGHCRHWLDIFVFFSSYRVLVNLDDIFVENSLYLAQAMEEMTFIALSDGDEMDKLSALEEVECVGLYNIPDKQPWVDYIQKPREKGGGAKFNLERVRAFLVHIFSKPYLSCLGIAIDSVFARETKAVNLRKMQDYEAF